MHAGIVQKIFRDHFDDYNERHKLSPRELNAAGNIMACHTDALGYHVDECPNGCHRAVLRNACKHRSCPLCGSTETEVWLERRNLQALDCQYYHTTITIPHLLHVIWLWNRRLFTNLMFLAAWHSLRELIGSDNRHGVYTGAIGVFQSWGDELQKHCHLHFLIPAGGLDNARIWRRIEGEFLLPTGVVASKFRGKFCAYLKEGFNPLTKRGIEKPKDQLLEPPDGMSVQQCLNLFNKLGRVNWHVDIEPAYDYTEEAFKYLGRYIRRGPISEKRILSYDGKKVRIAYAHPDKHEKPYFDLDVDTFIQRILTHVPEKGTHTVRAYGLFHPSCIDKLNCARAQLGQSPYEPLTDLPHAQELLARMFPDWDGMRCPECGELLQTVYYDRRGMPPPELMAA